MEKIKLPEEVRVYIRTLAPSSQNNSRTIVRENCLKILRNFNHFEAIKIINARYGLSIDPGEDPADKPPF